MIKKNHRTTYLIKNKPMAQENKNNRIFVGILIN